MTKSCCEITTSAISSITGNTSTIAKDVWRKLSELKGESLTNLCTPASLCKYPNCTHLHESDCAVKDALADYRISVRRYDSYCQMVEDPGE
jgi:hypothetical protein